ncbi:hypothetical protein FRX31_005464 [Thalictrum thalictroides]|uniref:Uncharacterized protein n=1 Tax=Thalictrum thalictroides TaxID=46969 RepID=A0A7J6X5D2_THATH|nr:hypothetical protein FRX31_005464 [Thalictrum thalictroides]
MVYSTVAKCLDNYFKCLKYKVYGASIIPDIDNLLSIDNSLGSASATKQLMYRTALWDQLIHLNKRKIQMAGKLIPSL